VTASLVLIHEAEVLQQGTHPHIEDLDLRIGCVSKAAGEGLEHLRIISFTSAGLQVKMKPVRSSSAPFDYKNGTFHKLKSHFLLMGVMVSLHRQIWTGMIELIFNGTSLDLTCGLYPFLFT
jgi:hypothetical protein